MSYSEQVKKDAKAAADYIREHGWTNQGAELPTGECCPVTALCRTVDDYDARRAVWSAIKSETGCNDIVPWNEEPGRTKEEVLAVFDRIANS